MAAARKKLTSVGGIKNCVWQIYHSSCLSEFLRRKQRSAGFAVEEAHFPSIGKKSFFYLPKP